MTTTTIARPKRRLRLPRYSMATLFGFVTIFCLFFGLVVRPAEEQKRAVKALRSIDNVRVHYDFQYNVIVDHEDNIIGSSGVDPPPPGPAWLREKIGVDYFADVVYVHGFDPKSGETRGLQADDLRHLQNLRSLELLYLSSTCVTDREVDFFASLPKLKTLILEKTKVSDAGLAKLRDATNLRIITLTGSQFSSDALVHLAKLTKLRKLNLKSCSNISDGGLVHLRNLTELRTLDLEGTQTTDDGLRHLAGLTELTRLTLDDTKISGEGLRHLESMTALRKLSLSNTSVSDKHLKHLYGLRQLTFVVLYDTEVTQEGVEDLQRALPNCTIRWGWYPVGLSRGVVPYVTDEADDENVQQ